MKVRRKGRGAPPRAKAACLRHRPGAAGAHPFRRAPRFRAGPAAAPVRRCARIAAALSAALLLLWAALFFPPGRAPFPGGERNGAAAPARAGAVVALAERLAGTRYTAGGESPAGFDCSGYTAYVYQTAAGIALPHSAAAQAKMGEASALAGLEPGDLVFFDTAGGGAATHCGVFLGGGCFLAANSGNENRVGAGSLADPYWKSKFLFGRRLLVSASKP